MYILVEHSGTPDHNKAAEFIKDFAEDEFGYTCESVIGSENALITVYTESLEKIAEFNKDPDETELYFYFKYLKDEEED